VVDVVRDVDLGEVEGVARRVRRHVQRARRAADVHVAEEDAALVRVGAGHRLEHLRLVAAAHALPLVGDQAEHEAGRALLEQRPLRLVAAAERVQLARPHALAVGDGAHRLIDALEQPTVLLHLVGVRIRVRISS